LGTAPGYSINLAFAPDGRRLALDLYDGRQWDVWVNDWARDTLSRLTFDGGNEQRPVWTPDGGRIVFASTRADGVTYNLYWQRADGTGETQRLTDGKNRQLPASWHPSGQFLGFIEHTAETSWDLMILPLTGNDASAWRPGTPAAFLNTPFTEIDPMFSPDGRWLAYSSNESGRDEIYVRPFPGPGGKWQISTGGGTDPTWSRVRQELFYLANGQHMVSTYSAIGDPFRAEKSRLWSERHFRERGGGPVPTRPFDLHPDGKRFAIIGVPAVETDATSDRVTLLFHLFDELRRIAPPARR
jgi:serine/threonine-protein kinase